MTIIDPDQAESPPSFMFRLSAFVETGLLYVTDCVFGLSGCL